jgi:hypothetical protein
MTGFKVETSSLHGRIGGSGDSSWSLGFDRSGVVALWPFLRLVRPAGGGGGSGMAPGELTRSPAFKGLGTRSPRTDVYLAPCVRRSSIGTTTVCSG